MRSADARKIPHRVWGKLVPAWPDPGLVGVGNWHGKEEEQHLQEHRQAKQLCSSLRRTASPL